MRRLFEKWSCKHKWKLVKEITYKDGELKTDITQLYLCEHCGKFKKIKF